MLFFLGRCRRRQTSNESQKQKDSKEKEESVLGIMIKRITLKNFESHEDSTIEFSDGLNLIIGQSNQGKSSIVRALAMVVANRFDRDSVRTGAKYCSVAVETEKGTVTAERGEDTNHWIIETPRSFYPFYVTFRSF